MAALYNVINFVPSPYPKTEMPFLSLRANFNSDVESKNVVVRIKGLRGNILKTSNLSIFSRRKAAKNCPKCGQWKSQILYFDLD